MSKVVLGNTVVCVLMLLLGGVACVKEKDTRIRVALNAWPGYEFMFVSEELGFFEKVGLNVTLVETTSLQDSLQRLLMGRVDAMGCTAVEALLAADDPNISLSPLIYFDYSDGSNVILADKGLDSIESLRGKRIGVERASIGLVLLYRALESAQMSFEDVELVFLDQIDMEKRFGDIIDAVVCYPPVSTRIARSTEVELVFSSANIPYEVIDMIAVNREFEEAHPDLYDKFQRVWEITYDFWKTHPKVANAIMARRLGITLDELGEEFEGIAMMTPEEQHSPKVGSQISKSFQSADVVLREIQLLKNEPEYESLVRLN